MANEQELTIKDAARLCGTVPDYVRQAVLAGRIKARKIGPLWLVDKASLLEWDKARKVRGRGGVRGTDENLID